MEEEDGEEDVLQSDPRHTRVSPDRPHSLSIPKIENPFEGELPTPVPHFRKRDRKVRQADENQLGQLHAWEKALSKFEIEFEKPIMQAVCLSPDEKRALSTIKQNIDESLQQEESFYSVNDIWEESLEFNGATNEVKTSRPPAVPNTPPTESPPEIPLMQKCNISVTESLNEILTRPLPSFPVSPVAHEKENNRKLNTTVSKTTTRKPLDKLFAKLDIDAVNSDAKLTDSVSSSGLMYVHGFLELDLSKAEDLRALESATEYCAKHLKAVFWRYTRANPPSRGNFFVVFPPRKEVEWIQSASCIFEKVGVGILRSSQVSGVAS